MTFLIERLVIKNYKSIAATDLRIGRLAFFVGPNGSGKSNILDSLCFIRDALTTNIDNALRERGGIQDVRRKSKGHPTHFGIRIEFRFRQRQLGQFAFEIVSKPKGNFEVGRETCDLEIDGAHLFYDIRNGHVVDSNIERYPTPSSNHLYLLSVSGLSGFKEVYQNLCGMGFYSINPQSIRNLQSPNPGDILRSEGDNLASVLWNIQNESKGVSAQIQEYLTAIVPSIHSIERKALGPMETIEFRQGMKGDKYPWRFHAASMSDGTLRALGVLTAIFQVGRNKPISLVGIEEPEAALHPAAAGILMEALHEASKDKQILITSHSSDLLDSKPISIDNLFAVIFREGISYAGSVDEETKEILHSQLLTPGELLRLDQIDISADIFESQVRQLDIFSSK